MKIVAKFLLLTVIVAMAGTVSAQQMDTPRDGAYDEITTEERQVIPYDPIREADVFWKKRVWRAIDVREKMNLPFKYPKQYLVDIFRDAGAEGTITLYDREEDDFSTALTPAEVAKIGVGEPDTFRVTDPVTGKEIVEIESGDFDPTKVTKFRIKEDWIFDEESASMKVRILGIAPIMEIWDDNGVYRGDQVLFWVYYPEARQTLAGYEVFNPENDAMRLSWEQLFEMRLFTSYVIKESNVYDRRIKDYATGIDGLWEAERVEAEIFNFEHDLWSY